jgi:adenylate cyclase
VRYLLEGSVRRAAGRVRITARLIDGEDGAQIWAERFEDTLDDLFALQDKVALAVAGAIEPAVRESEIRRASRRPTDSQGGYDLYLRALALYRAHTQAENFQALDLLGRAITLDPEFGAAIALAASAHSRIVAFAWSGDVEGNRRQGVELARRALRLAGDDPDVFIRAASVLSYDTADDVAGFFERALALNPASAIAHLAMSDYHLMHGDPKLGQAHIETAMRLDPLSPLRATHLGMLGSALFMQGRFAEAIAPLRESVHLQAAPPQSFAVLAACHGQLGEIEAARAALAEVRARTQAPIRELGANLIRAPAQRRLFLEGIARAEDEAP